MTPALIVVAGLLVLALGVVSRRPWGRWWDGGGVLAEQLATLIAPPVGLAVTCAGLGVWVGERSALTPVLGADCPVAVVVRASWPEERVIRGTLGDIVGRLAEEPVERTATILVGRALAAGDFRESALYDPDYQRRFRGR